MKKLCSLLTMLITLAGLGQTLISGTGDNAPVNPSAVLELRSISGQPKGLMVPQHESNIFQNALLNGIADEDKPYTGGLLAYDSSRSVFRFYNHKQGLFSRLNPWQDHGTRLNLYSNTNAYNSMSWMELWADPDNGGDRRGQLTLAGKTVSLWAGSEADAFGSQKVLVKEDEVVVSTNLEVSSPNTISGYGTIPIGGIIMWSGADIPDGWALCDGENGTPNLSGRFLVGIGQYSDTTTNYSMGQIGGEEAHELSVAELPRHHHEAKENTDNPNGATIHIGSSGPHHHTINKEEGDGGGDGEFFDMTGGTGQTNDDRPSTLSRGVHQHTNQDFDGIVGNGRSTGLNNQPHENRPPYYALAFIMRIQ